MKQRQALVVADCVIARRSEPDTHPRVWADPLCRASKNRSARLLVRVWFASGSRLLVRASKNCSARLMTTSRGTAGGGRCTDLRFGSHCTDLAI